MKRVLSTADVPQQFLQAAYLVGHVPLKALEADPRVSYMLYIPPAHYDSDTNSRKLPLLVWIHGTRRRLGALEDGDLVAFANSTPCAILAPIFPAGLDGPNDLDSYKLLRSTTFRSDLALLSMLDEISPRWPGIATDKVFMLGFSGGGQFVHRFLYLHPERLLAVSVGAPGRATVLDERYQWPLGIADVQKLFARTINKELIRDVAVQLAVGDEDNEVHGGNDFWTWLQKVQGKESDTTRQITNQGRLQVVRHLHAAWASDDINCQLDVVPGAAHEAGKIRPSQLQFLGYLMQVAIE
ncbi:uncharacterized protein N7483_012602 [Penicillium malachiteum]|uniref:uncharacterized protein n=1 Tax=Penicillium malachiteum TaxID=1324776 RepID=UPI002546C267|nr:uncharacterized protein N7483_012602 [Penicillium malachiteum]KAJ5715421.1 hypothetical protein N7483_012602 [Penicillium malachiteum]